MEIKYKRWTGLGLGVALTAGGLAACGGTETVDPPAAEEASDAPAETSSPAAGVAGHGGEGEGGEGEGGVSIAAAAQDPVVYNAALAITEAHVIAARDAYAEGETAAAGEMFAHPVSEVLFDMQAVFEARGVEARGDHRSLAGRVRTCSGRRLHSSCDRGRCGRRPNRACRGHVSHRRGERPIRTLPGWLRFLQSRRGDIPLPRKRDRG